MEANSGQWKKTCKILKIAEMQFLKYVKGCTRTNKTMNKDIRHGITGFWTFSIVLYSRD
jgi:hypothetical protein